MVGVRSSGRLPGETAQVNKVLPWVSLGARRVIPPVLLVTVLANTASPKTGQKP